MICTTEKGTSYLSVSVSMYLIACLECVWLSLSHQFQSQQDNQLKPVNSTGATTKHWKGLMSNNQQWFGCQIERPKSSHKKILNRIPIPRSVQMAIWYSIAIGICPSLVCVNGWFISVCGRWLTFSEVSSSHWDLCESLLVSGRICARNSALCFTCVFSFYFVLCYRNMLCGPGAIEAWSGRPSLSCSTVTNSWVIWPVKTAIAKRLAAKTVPKMTYNVSSGTFSFTVLHMFYLIIDKW